MNKSEQLIACLEGEIAKRDAELAACRVAVENCDLFRARIAELESQFDGESIVCGYYRDERDAALAELSAIKAQGVVMPEPMKRGDEGGSGEYGAAMIRGYNACLREVARLNAAPVQQVSVPDGFERYRLANKFCEQRLVTDDHVRAIVVDAFASGYGFGIAAAPAAPAADAGASLIEWTKDAVEWGGALNYAAWEFVNECPEKSALLFNNTKGPLRAAIMKYAEIVTAHCAKGVV